MFNVQRIGDSISKGDPINGFKFKAEKQPVLYFDFELSDKQFEGRYSRDFESHYSFDNNFYRVEINPEAEMPSNQNFENYLDQSLEETIIETGAKVLIIDNLTYLKNETEKAMHALPLMKNLKRLKSKYGLSILVLAHTPKRNLSKPITRNDLQGSKMLINFCDSSFAIGENHSDRNLRYLKQIKARNTETIYDTENVCVCQVDKPFNFLMLEFISFGVEREHLKQLTDKDKEDRKKIVFDLNQQRLSLRKIGKEIGISHTEVGRILKKGNSV